MFSSVLRDCKPTLDKNPMMRGSRCLGTLDCTRNIYIVHVYIKILCDYVDIPVFVVNISIGSCIRHGDRVPRVN